LRRGLRGVGSRQIPAAGSRADLPVPDARRPARRSPCAWRPPSCSPSGPGPASPIVLAQSAILGYYW